MDTEVEKVKADTVEFLRGQGITDPDVSYLTKELLLEYAATQPDQPSDVKFPEDEAPENTPDWWAYGNHFAIWPALKRCAYTTNGAGAACGQGMRFVRSYDQSCWTMDVASCGSYRGLKIWGI
jgi:hypothetical protein